MNEIEAIGVVAAVALAIVVHRLVQGGLRAITLLVAGALVAYALHLILD